ncbi:hypothetical protein FOCC_FOCC011024 [Frankliniella occidentalis]|nr:hypothetical protein FOCC_FOCC011024 [Frankliniella occidentalis]
MGTLWVPYGYHIPDLEIYFPSKPYVSTVSSLLRFACEVMLTTTRSAADNIIVYNQKIDKGVLTTE